MTEWLSLDSNYSLELSFHIEICSVHLALVETLLVLGRCYGWVLKWVEMFILAILMIIPMIISFNSDTHIDPSLSSSLSSSLSPSLPLPWSSSSSSLLTDHYPAPLRCGSCPEKDFFSFIFDHHWPFSTSPAVFLFNREACPSKRMHFLGNGSGCLSRWPSHFLGKLQLICLSDPSGTDLTVVFIIFISISIIPL